MVDKPAAQCVPGDTGLCGGCERVPRWGVAADEHGGVAVV